MSSRSLQTDREQSPAETCGLDVAGRPFAEVLNHVRRVELSEDDNQPETIYAQRPCGPTSAALLAKAPPDGRTSPVNGCDYFLEASVAQDFFRELSAPFEEGCGRIIQYAEKDA